MNESRTRPRKPRLVVITGRTQQFGGNHGDASRDGPLRVSNGVRIDSGGLAATLPTGFLEPGTRHAQPAVYYRARAGRQDIFGRLCLRPAGMRRNSCEPQRTQNTSPTLFATRKPAIDAHRVA